MSGWSAGRSLSSMSHDCSRACLAWGSTGPQEEKSRCRWAALMPFAVTAMSTTPRLVSLTSASSAVPSAFRAAVAFPGRTTPR
jgi:hypothetical protein